MTLQVKPISEIEVKSEVSADDKILILDSVSEEARLASKDELKWAQWDPWEKWEPWEQGLPWPQWDPWTPWKDWEDGKDWNWITSVTSEKVWKTTTVTMNFDEWEPFSFEVQDWQDGGGGSWSWDVVWPASSTDGDVAIFDWATGKLIKDGSVALSTLSSAASLASSAVQPWDNISDLNNDSWYITNSYHDATKQDVLTAGTNIQIQNNVISATAWSDIEYVTQAEYTALLPWAASDGKHYFIYTSSGWGWGWQPWANTVAYYPLDTDFNDASSNNYNLTNSWWVITTLDWVACAYYDGSSHSATATPTFTGTRTLSCWWNPASTSGVMWIIVTGNLYNNNEKWWTQQNSWVLWGSEWRTTNQSVNSNITVTTWTWYYVVTTIENWTEAKIYVNGVLANTLTRNNPIQNSYWLAVGSNFSDLFSEPATWYISNAIIEDKARTAQEVSDYYNLTKWNYWIS